MRTQRERMGIIGPGAHYNYLLNHSNRNMIRARISWSAILTYHTLEFLSMKVMAFSEKEILGNIG